MYGSGASDGIHDVLATLVTLFACGYGVMFLYRVLRRGRPELSIGLPIFVAFGVRLISLVALPLTGIERTLRGGDEVGFLASAADTASSTFGSGAWLDSLTGALYEFVFATQIALFDSPELTLRITQLTISVLGLMLLAVAVYELAGRRAALVAMWVMALEPTNVFFSTYLHKEPNMILASGMVAFGGTMIWKHGQVRWIALITTGCLIAVATRPYAGWFLIAAGAAIMLHAGLRQGAAGGVRRFGLIAVVLLFGAIAAPTVLRGLHRREPRAEPSGLTGRERRRRGRQPQPRAGRLLISDGDRDQPPQTGDRCPCQALPMATREHQPEARRDRSSDYTHGALPARGRTSPQPWCDHGQGRSPSLRRVGASACLLAERG